MRGFLHISGNGLRIVDKETKALIADHCIEKVSFCSVDLENEHGISYIYRDGTTCRWMCHGFLATKDSGERLAQAIGIAFAIYMKQIEEHQAEIQRLSSFRRSKRLHNERGVDVGNRAPAAIVSPQPQAKPKPYNPHAIERPHATPTMIERQNSSGGLSTLNNQSPFKRQTSLRLNDLPSNIERQRLFMETLLNTQNIRSISPMFGCAPSLIPSQFENRPSSTEMSLMKPIPAPRTNVNIVEKCTEIAPNLSNGNESGNEFKFELQTVNMTITSSTTENSLPPTIHANANEEIIVINSVDSDPSVTKVLEIITPIKSNDPIPNTFTSDEISESMAQLTNGNIENLIETITPNPSADVKPSNSNGGTATHSSHSNSNPVKTPAIAIVAPINAQQPNVENDANEFQTNESHETTENESHAEMSLNSSQDHLNANPFDSAWFESVAEQLNDLSFLPQLTTDSLFIDNTEEDAIAVQTNPFLE